MKYVVWKDLGHKDAEHRKFMKVKYSSPPLSGRSPKTTGVLSTILSHTGLMMPSTRYAVDSEFYVSQQWMHMLKNVCILEEDLNKGICLDSLNRKTDWHLSNCLCSSH